MSISKKILLLTFLYIIYFSVASAGISTKKQDILKLIGTSYAFNGKFAWIELNGVDYGWTREGKKIGKYKIVIVEMGKVLVESNKKTVLLVMLEGTQFEVKQ